MSGEIHGSRGLWLVLNVVLSILLGGATHYVTGLTRLSVLESKVETIAANAEHTARALEQIREELRTIRLNQERRQP
jgi:hypothetical protein